MKAITPVLRASPPVGAAQVTISATPSPSMSPAATSAAGETLPATVHLVMSLPSMIDSAYRVPGLPSGSPKIGSKCETTISGMSLAVTLPSQSSSSS